jgi:hypothetical protein
MSLPNLDAEMMLHVGHALRMEQPTTCCCVQASYRIRGLGKRGKCDIQKDWDWYGRR